MTIRCKNCFQEYDEELGLCPHCGYAEGDPAAEVFCLLPGTEIAGRYVVGEMLGLGGFGITYKAWDKKLNTIVAIKEFYPSGLVNRLPGDPNVILVASRREHEFVYGKTRFLEEARNMAKFSTHKNIVNVFDYFEANHTAYIVMEFLDGNTLSQILQQQNEPLSCDYCVQIASGVCAALRAIHKENILHRDVSPDNIMICRDGSVKLFDFGAARFSAGLENRVTVVVKPGFAPPEQYDKVNRQDARTDIYALGATLYYAMTGVKPEESTNRKIEDKLVEPAKIVQTIPQTISTALMRAMAIEQQYRFSSVDEFEKALQGDREVASVEKERAKRRRRRTAGIAASLLLVAVAAGIFLLVVNHQKKTAALPDAALEVWYIQSGDEAWDHSKEAALDTIVETFTKEYPNITVNLTPVNAEDYASALLTACQRGNAPDIFESTELQEEDLASAVPLTAELKELADDAYCINALNDEKRYPISLSVPVIYVNTAKGPAETIRGIDELKEICEERGEYFVVNESDVGVYAALYGDQIADYCTETAREEFFSREAFVYFGDSADFFAVQDALPGEYTVLLPDTDTATYWYGSTWSVSAENENTEKSAIALLAYFDSPLAQEYFHIQNKSGELPICKETMEVFSDVYEEFSGIDEYLEKPFLKAEKDSQQILANMNTSNLEKLKSEANRNLFEDVADENWYADAITAVCTAGLMEGTSSTTFEPEKIMTKSGIITALYRAAGSPAAKSPAPFSDIESGTERGQAAAWAYESGITAGASDGLYHGDSSVNLETAMLLLYRYAEHAGYDMTIETEPDQFADGSTVSKLASDGVMWAITNQLISVQPGGSISPKAEMRRGQFAVILQNLVASAPGK